MRSLALGVALAGCVGASYGPRAEPAQPIVILVHGRGQWGHDTTVLRRDWKRDLDSALATVAMPPLPDDGVRLAWYADLLDPESDALCPRRAVADDSLDFGDFARGFLALLASAAPQDETSDVRNLMGDLLYVLDPAKRCAAESRVARAIGAAAATRRPVVVVAYSLGSLVTYGALRSLADAGTPLGDVHLVTVGSPLGVRAIREIVFGDGAPLRAPAGVASWDNVYDANDFFSAPLADALSGVRDHATHARAEQDPHGLDRYSRDPAMGESLRRALCAAPAVARAAGCRSRTG